MRWFSRVVDCAGSVYFRGTLPPRLDKLESLASAGVSVTPGPPSEAAHWTATARHEEWGTAEIVCPRHSKGPSRDILEMDVSLTPGEREVASLGDCSVVVQMRGKSHVLRDRRCLLGFLRAVMGKRGLVALDHTSHRHWSREALEEELFHDAVPDVDMIYALHAVRQGLGAPPSWLHSHGMADLGYVDFDILNPAADLFTSQYDAVRAVALAILEGDLTLSSRTWTFSNRGDVRLVGVSAFLRQAAPRILQARPDAGGEHGMRRGVVCDAGGGLLGRWIDHPKPSRLLSEDQPPEAVVNFSAQARALMDERARQTYPLLCRLTEELEPYHLPLVATVAYEPDHGGPRERLWVTVDDVLDDRIDGVLLSEPAHITRMHVGQHAVHYADRIVDWQIQTPFGLVTPRNTIAARLIREQNPEEFQRCLAEFRIHDED